MNKSSRNKTLSLSPEEILHYNKQLLFLNKNCLLEEVINRTINGNILEVVNYLPKESVDLLFIDPPYNLTKIYNESTFKKTNILSYIDWLNCVFDGLDNLLKPTSSIYICYEKHIIFYRSANYYKRNKF